MTAVQTFKKKSQFSKIPELFFCGWVLVSKCSSWISVAATRNGKSATDLRKWRKIWKL